MPAIPNRMTVNLAASGNALKLNCGFTMLPNKYSQLWLSGTVSAKRERTLVGMPVKCSGHEYHLNGSTPSKGDGFPRSRSVLPGYGAELAMDCDRCGWWSELDLHLDPGVCHLFCAADILCVGAVVAISRR